MIFSNQHLRLIGQTGIKVSPLGLGTVKFGRNTGVKYPNSFNLPDDSSVKDILSSAKDLGINVLDTAPAYGNSESRLGKLLSSRHDWAIVSKAGENFVNGESHFDFTKSGIVKSVENSLKNLKTDYIDVLLIHSSGDDLKIINDYEVFNTLSILKQQGKIKSYGMSSKTVAGGILTLQYADVAMVTYNPSYTEEVAVIDYAAENNKGILIKKAFASGHLDRISGSEPVLESLKLIFQHPQVSSVIVGTINLKHLKSNVAAALQVLS